MNESFGFKIIVASIILLLTIFLFIFRKFIAYPFCSLDKYGGSYGGMKKASRIFVIYHMLPTSFFSILVFLYLSNLNVIYKYFDEHPVIRISSFIGIFLIIFFFNGVIIEYSLENIDKDYKAWKDSRLKKYKHK